MIEGPETTIRMLEQSGALLKGHFLLTSGLHSGNYLQCAMLLRNTGYAAEIGAELAALARELKPEIVVSPAVGGLIVGHEVARNLNLPFIFCEREQGKMVLRRFPHPGRVRVLVVEDVITTGGSVKEVGEHLAQGGAQWVGSAAIVDRSQGKHVLAHDLISLVKASFPVYRPEECPFCREGKPLVKPGSRNLDQT